MIMRVEHKMQKLNQIKFKTSLLKNIRCDYRNP